MRSPSRVGRNCSTWTVPLVDNGGGILIGRRLPHEVELPVLDRHPTTSNVGDVEAISRAFSAPT